jgi:hypothetical protein
MPQAGVSTALNWTPSTLPDSQPAAQTAYQPGGGNAFFAGLEELFTSPTAFFQDATAGGDSGYLPPAQPGGGSAFVAGLEEVSTDPGQAASDFASQTGIDKVLPSLPSFGELVVIGGLVVIGILGVAYISHKAL